MKLKKARKIYIPGNTKFVVINIIMIVLLITSLALSIADNMCNWIYWPYRFEEVIGVSAQIITGIVSLIASIVGIAISLQNEECFGIRVTKLYELRAERHYSIICIIIVSILLCMVNLTFYMLELTIASIGSIFVALIFLVKVILDEVPIMVKKENAIKHILRNKVIDCYLKEEAGPSALEEAIKYWIYSDTLNNAYGFMRSEEDLEYNDFLIMYLLDIQQKLASEIKDRHDDRSQKIIASSLTHNALDLMYKKIALTGEQYEKIKNNKHLITRVIFSVLNIESTKALFLNRMYGLLQSLSFRGLTKKETELIETIIISLVSGTVKENDFSVIKEIRRYFSVSDWDLREDNGTLTIFAVISVFLYYMCVSEASVPKELKENINKFIEESGHIEKNTRIISWKTLFGVASHDFKVNYNEFIRLAMENEHNLEYWLFGIGAKIVVWESSYLTRWYIAHLLNSNEPDLNLFSDQLKADMNLRHDIKSLGTKCFDKKKTFVPTEEMTQMVTFYKDKAEPFELLKSYTYYSDAIFEFINTVKTEDVMKDVELALQMDNEEFVNEIKCEIEKTLSEEWGFSRELPITNSARYFSVMFEKDSEVVNLREFILDYSKRAVLDDIRKFIKKSVIYKSDKFEMELKTIFFKNVGYITAQAKSSIPLHIISDKTLCDDYKARCSPLTEFESDFIGPLAIVTKKGFSFNCIIDNVEIRNLDEEELSKKVAEYQREDGQYVFDGAFIPLESIERIVRDKFVVLTLIMRHQNNSSKESIFELRPYSRNPETEDEDMMI